MAMNFQYFWLSIQFLSMTTKTKTIHTIIEIEI